jgi:uncharacterized protein (TIGR02118 family)
MARLIAMYKKPADASAFDRYYFAQHVPLAKTFPGLRAYDVSHGPIVTPDGLAPYHLIATLTFDSVDAIQAALSSTQGQAIVADLGNFAAAGADVYIIDTKSV